MSISLHRAHQTIVVLSWALSNCILTPVEIHWLRLFWSRRRNPFISKRRPRMLLFQMIAFWLWALLDMSVLTMDAFRSNLHSDVWLHVATLLVPCADLCGIIFVSAIMTRSWLLFFSSVVFLLPLHFTQFFST